MTSQTATAHGPVIRPAFALLAEVERRSGEKVSRCYQCRKCTNGCPLAFAMDLMPNQVMRAVQLGLEEEVFGSDTIWVCASCQTCTTRCPNDIDIAHLMDTLRQLSGESGVAAAQPKIVKFHQAFLDSVRRHGRLFELGMVGRYKLSSRDFFGGAKLGMEMVRKGKLKFLPAGIKGKHEVRQMFKSVK
jgi:heterodisulfide reductase subunit C